MKKLPLLVCFFSTPLLFLSCKKEVDETQNLKEIETLVIQQDLPKEVFAEKVLPLVKELHSVDSSKYQRINHIAEKAQKEKNKSIYKINVENLKEALKYVK